MAAPKGNQFWLNRSKHGRDKLFDSPELLREAAYEYFQWCVDNPLYESKAFAYEGSVAIKELPKLRAFTWAGLCLYLGCNEVYFRNFKNQKRTNGDDFSSVLSEIEQIIYDQKFTAAAADLLNSNIIARDLGLADKKQVAIDPPVDEKSTEELQATLNKVLAKINGGSNTEGIA